VTPDRKAWVKVEQVKQPGIASVSPSLAAAPATAVGSGKPAWAS
jgi:hypothetical protein